MSCIKGVYNLCGFLTDNFSGRISVGCVRWASLVRTDRISFWLVTLLVSQTSLSNQQLWEHLYAPAFHPLLKTRGERGARNIRVTLLLTRDFPGPWPRQLYSCSVDRIG